MGHITIPTDLAEVINLHREMFGGYHMEATEEPPAEPAAEQPEESTPPAGDESTATDDDEPLGDGGRKALAAERKAAREMRKQLADAQAKLQAIEDEGKTELQKATDAAARAQKEADEARRELTRERVARKHNLSDEDTDLLTGDEEQMERLAARLGKVTETTKNEEPKARPTPAVGAMPEARNISLADQIKAAEKAGDHHLVRTLKAMQLTAAANT